MSCRINHNLICLGFGPSSKGLGVILKFLTNRNVQFHWTLLLGPLSKVALNGQGYKFRSKFSTFLKLGEMTEDYM
jgi:hypothetical protein